MLFGTSETLFSQATARRADEFEVGFGRVLLVLEQNALVLDTERGDVAAGMGCTGQTVRWVVLSGVPHAAEVVLKRVLVPNWFLNSDKTVF